MAVIDLIVQKFYWTRSSTLWTRSDGRWYETDDLWLSPRLVISRILRVKPGRDSHYYLNGFHGSWQIHIFLTQNSRKYEVMETDFEPLWTQHTDPMFRLLLMLTRVPCVLSARDVEPKQHTRNKRWRRSSCWELRTQVSDPCDIYWIKSVPTNLYKYRVHELLLSDLSRQDQGRHSLHQVMRYLL